MATKKSKKKVSKKTNRASFAIATLQHYIKQQASIIYPPQTKHNSREGELHPSSYPFCGLEHGWNILNKVQQKPMDYMGNFYTGLGTFMHELMQRQFGRGKQILGDWKCLECGKKKKLTFYSRCKRCGSEHVEYEELLIKFKKYTVGHVDGVVELDGKLWVIDYKSTSVKNNNKHRETGTQYPYKKNTAQIKSYCFHPDTLVITDKGKIRIQDIVASPIGTYKALSYSHLTRTEEYKDISFTSVHTTKQEMFEIEYEGGTVRLTEDHEVWSVTRQKYVKVKELEEGEEMLLAKD